MTLIWLASAWALGIWLGRVAWDLGWMGCGRPGWLAWSGLLALPLIGLIAARRWERLRWPAWLLLLLLLGGLRYQMHPFAPCFDAGDLAAYQGDEAKPAWVTVTGTVIKPPEERDTRVRVRLRAESVAVGRDEVRKEVAGDALFTVERYPELHVGDRVEVRGRLEAAPVFEGFNYREYLARAGVHSLIQEPTVTVLGRGGGSFFWRGLYELRLRAQGIIARLLPEPEAALLSGILLGVETGIDRGLYDQFNKTGVSHIIVISGFNITIIAGLLTALLGRLVGKRRAFYPVIAGIALYTLLVGADAAVTRAAVMGGLYAWAIYLGRQSTAAVSLFFAGFLMTLLNPLSLWDVGFQLSFMATLSLILFTPGMTSWFEARMGGEEREGAGERGSAGADVRKVVMAFLNDALIVTLAAQILTLPLVAHYFGRVSIVSPLANLLVLPVQPYVMIWGGLAVIAGFAPVLWPLARLLALIPWLTLHWTVGVVKLLASLRFAASQVTVSLPALWGFYGLLALGMLSDRPRLPLLGGLLPRLRSALTSSAAVTLAAGGTLTAAALLLVVLNSQPDGQLHVHFLDVGRGEAVLIVTPDGQQVLVDGGYSPTALLSALGEHIPFYDRQIELVVLTHPGDERIGGLAGLADRYKLKQVLQAPFPYPSASFEGWLRELQAAGTPIARAERGVRVELGYGAALDVLHPAAKPVLKESGELDLAANSLVLRLTYGESCFLLTGDLPAAGQDELAGSGLAGPCWVVKLPDGGRQAAFSEALLDATRPLHGVVFAQREDRFRDLSTVVADEWSAVVGPANFHRTDLAGTVSFSTDGQFLNVRP